MLMLFFFTIDRAQFSPMAYQVVQFLKKNCPFNLLLTVQAYYRQTDRRKTDIMSRNKCVRRCTKSKCQQSGIAAV